MAKMRRQKRISLTLAPCLGSSHAPDQPDEYWIDLDVSDGPKDTIGRRAQLLLSYDELVDLTDRLRKMVEAASDRKQHEEEK